MDQGVDEMRTKMNEFEQKLMLNDEQTEKKKELEAARKKAQEEFDAEMAAAI